jgi:hypothetical protein
VRAGDTVASRLVPNVVDVWNPLGFLQYARQLLVVRLAWPVGLRQ